MSCTRRSRSTRTCNDRPIGSSHRLTLVEKEETLDASLIVIHPAGTCSVSAIWRARRDLNPRPFPERASTGSLFRLRASAFWSLLLYLAEPPDRTSNDPVYGPMRPAENPREPRILIKIVENPPRQAGFFPHLPCLASSVPSTKLSR